MMKRIIALLLSLLLLSTGLAYAAPAEPDYAAYSFDELIAMQEKINFEIKTRPEAGKHTLEPGKYIIGKDIPQGEYLAHFAPKIENSEDSENSITYANVILLENVAIYDEAMSIGYGAAPLAKTRTSVSKETPTTKLSLANGNLLLTEGTTVDIERIGNITEKPIPEYSAPEGTIIPTGTYVAGELIPAGSYAMHYDGVSLARVRTYAEVPSPRYVDLSKTSSILDPFNALAYITVTDGMAIKIEYGSVIMKKMTAFSFD